MTARGLGKMTPEAAVQSRTERTDQKHRARLRKARRSLVEPSEAIKAIETRFGPGSAPRALPRHVRPYANYMVSRQGVEPSVREIVKAYATTRSSVQRGARATAQVCARYPEYRPLRRMIEREDARPEDVFAVLLFSPAGKQYLDAAERGEFDSKAAREITDRMRCFGLDETLHRDLKYAVELGARRAEIAEALKLGPESWVSYVRDRIKGVSAAKAGFIAALLGRGDVPTFDAREINLWRKKTKKKALSKTQRRELGCEVVRTAKGAERFTGMRNGKPDRRCKPSPKFNAKLEDVIAYREKIRDYPLALSAEHEPFREHLVHHALWDAYPDEGGKQSKTTHGSVIRAMQFAGTKRRPRK